VLTAVAPVWEKGSPEKKDKENKFSGILRCYRSWRLQVAGAKAVWRGRGRGAGTKVPATMATTPANHRRKMGGGRGGHTGPRNRSQDTEKTAGGKSCKVAKQKGGTKNNWSVVGDRGGSFGSRGQQYGRGDAWQSVGGDRGGGGL